MKNRKIIKRILLAALLLAAAASSLLYWYLEGAFLPRWTHWSERDLTAVMRDRPEMAMYSRYPAGALESSEASGSAGNPGTDGSGADLIIGTHPHCVQPMETVHTENGGTAVVYYSLGNVNVVVDGKTNNAYNGKDNMDCGQPDLVGIRNRNMRRIR